MRRARGGISRTATTVVVATGLLVAAAGAPPSQAQRIDGVYGLGRANLDGSNPDHLFIPTPRYSSGVAVDGEHVYWAHYDTTSSFDPYSIGRANLDGTGVDPTFISLPGPVGDVAVDATRIYWTNRWDGSIGRANLDGSGADPNFIAAGTPYPDGLALDATHIYWRTGTFNANAIARAELDGSNVEPQFIDVADPYASNGLAVDANYIYWTNFSLNEVSRANLDGSGVIQNFIGGLPDSSLMGLAVDSERIYWTTMRRVAPGVPPEEWVGAIGRANLDGSDIEPSFITGTSHIFDVAVDPGHVYWVNHAEMQPCFRCDLGPGDTTAPNTSITRRAPNKTERRRVEFEFKSDDRTATFECRLDRKGWRHCESPKTLRHLQTGRHIFRVRAVDFAGNADPTLAKDRFRVLP